MNRLRRALLFLALVGAASAQGQSARTLLEICTDEEGAAEILRRLDGWMSTARIARRSLADCEAGSAYFGRFRAEGGRTIFVLRNPLGGQLQQSLPWLEATATPLRAIDRRQRLPQFSLLLESLLAEDRLGLAVAPPPPEKPPTAPRSPPPAAAPPPAKKPRPAEQLTPAPKDESPPETAKEDVSSTAAPEPGVVQQEEPTILDLRPDEEEPTILDLHPDEDLSAPTEPPPRPAGIDDFRLPVPERWGWEAEAFGALRLRAPDFAAPETGLGLWHGPFGLRLGFQIPTRWAVEGRPLGVGAVWAALGLRQHERLGAWDLGLSLHLTGELLWLGRLDLPGARMHPYADLGLSLAAELRFPLLGGKMGVATEVGGTPSARTIRLPEGGSEVLGGVWGRVLLRWGIGG